MKRLPTPRARRTDPSTSHVAAARAGKVQVRHARRILAALEALGDGNIYDIARKSGLDHVQVARCLTGLGRAGYAEVTGRESNSPSGRPCRVWRRKNPNYELVFD